MTILAVGIILTMQCDRVPLPAGCANEANLRAMVAAPADLLQGRVLSPADGALEAAAVERLRAGKVKDLIRDGSGVSPGSAPK